MIDLHSHLMPAVDDGASSVDESRSGLGEMVSQGIGSIVTTPHVSASLQARPAELASYMSRVDAGWETLQRLVADEFPSLTIQRGFEILLDHPRISLGDPRLRLAGTRYVLVEFPWSGIPPNAVDALFEMKMGGFTPVIAHPERYPDMTPSLEMADRWRQTGAVLQLNAASFTGGYGKSAEELAWKLVANGWADLIASDFHSRGRCAMEPAAAKIGERAGHDRRSLLTEINPGRVIANLDLLPVSAFDAAEMANAEPKRRGLRRFL